MLEPVTDDAALAAALAAPGPIWLYKHSTRCHICTESHAEVSRYLAAHPDERVAMITVQTHRPLSNTAGERLRTVHQTPQLFLLDRGQVRWVASHWSITAEAMEHARRSLQPAGGA